MKTIFVVRHAKAEQNFIGSDFERKLTETGKENSKLMAKRIFHKFPEVDLFITSPAKRAKSTAQLFFDTYEANKDKFLIKSELYNAPAFVYSDLLSGLPDEINRVMLFGHNPGITHYVNTLGLVQIDNVPTAGCFVFTADTKHWKTLDKSKKAFLLFDYPKLNK